jgi:hypothetical protein
VARGQHVDPLRSELDRVGDRRVVGHAAVHEGAAFPRDGLEHTRDGSAGEDRTEYPAARKTKLLAGHHVHRDDVQRDPHLLELLAFDVTRDQTPQPRLGDEVVAGAKEAEQARDRVDREHLPATQAAPDTREALSGRSCLRAGGDVGAIERASGRAHDQIGRDVALVERTQHADLNRSQARSAGEDEGHLGLLSGRHD